MSTKISKVFAAIDFYSKEVYDEYMRQHPKANPKNHRILPNNSSNSGKGISLSNLSKVGNDLTSSKNPILSAIGFYGISNDLDEDFMKALVDEGYITNNGGDIEFNNLPVNIDDPSEAEVRKALDKDGKAEFDDGGFHYEFKAGEYGGFSASRHKIDSKGGAKPVPKPSSKFTSKLQKILDSQGSDFDLSSISEVSKEQASYFASRVPGGKKILVDKLNSELSKKKSFDDAGFTKEGLKKTIDDAASHCSPEQKAVLDHLLNKSAWQLPSVNEAIGDNGMGYEFDADNDWFKRSLTGSGDHVGFSISSIRDDGSFIISDDSSDKKKLDAYNTFLNAKKVGNSSVVCDSGILSFDTKVNKDGVVKNGDELNGEFSYNVDLSYTPVDFSKMSPELKERVKGMDQEELRKFLGWLASRK